MKYLLLICVFCSFCSADENSYKTILQQVMSEYEVPGLAVAIYYDGDGKIDTFGVANKKTLKPIDKNTIFDIASVTKVFTSTAVALEIMKGKMRLTDPITNYLPKKQSYNGLQNVTIKSLLTHSSSLARSPPKGKNHTFESIFHHLIEWTPPYPSETKYLYSNLGFGMLGYAIANAEKKPFRVSIKTLITKPLKMDSTFFQIPPDLQKNYAQGYLPDGVLAPRNDASLLPASGALRSTAADMLKFLMANLRVSGPKEIQEAMQLTHREFFVVNQNLAMGLGWQRYTHQHLLIVDKNGGLPGFSSYIGLLPYQQVGIVLLANKSKVPLTRIGREILRQFASQN